MKDKLIVGNPVFIQYIGFNRGHYREPAEKKIKSVGRKWFYVEGTDEGFSIETMLIDGRGYAPQRIAWLSMEHYQQVTQRNNQVSKLRSFFIPERFKDMTDAQLQRCDELMAEMEAENG
jgi:hypothetical protein